jgi:hypothetical protein
MESTQTKAPQTQLSHGTHRLIGPPPKSAVVTLAAGMARTGYLWKCAANVAAGPRAEVQMASPRPNRRLPEGNQR